MKKVEVVDITAFEVLVQGIILQNHVIIEEVVRVEGIGQGDNMDRKIRNRDFLLG